MTPTAAVSENAIGGKEVGSGGSFWSKDLRFVSVVDLPHAFRQQVRSSVKLRLVRNKSGESAASTNETTRD